MWYVLRIQGEPCHPRCTVRSRYAPGMHAYQFSQPVLASALCLSSHGSCHRCRCRRRARLCYYYNHHSPKVSCGASSSTPRWSTDTSTRSMELCSPTASTQPSTPVPYFAMGFRPGTWRSASAVCTSLLRRACMHGCMHGQTEVPGRSPMPSPRPRTGLWEFRAPTPKTCSTLLGQELGLLFGSCGHTCPHVCCRTSAEKDCCLGRVYSIARGDGRGGGEGPRIRHTYIEVTRETSHPFRSPLK